MNQTLSLTLTPFLGAVWGIRSATRFLWPRSLVWRTSAFSGTTIRSCETCEILVQRVIERGSLSACCVSAGNVNRPFGRWRALLLQGPPGISERKWEMAARWRMEA